MNKLKQIVSNSKDKVRPAITAFDTKVTNLIPNPKIKKILYIGVGSLFGFMFLIILLGLLLSPLRNTFQETGTVLNKPSILNTEPEKQKELTELQKQILNLETEIKELRFPESTLNMPILEDVSSI